MRNEVIARELISKFNRDSFALDRYVDRSDTVRLWVVRPIKPEDRELRKKLKALYDSDVQYRIKQINLTVKDSVMRKNALSMVYYGLAVKPVKVPCDSSQQILQDLLVRDQANRDHDAPDPKIDWENQVKVVSIIENCGFPESGPEQKNSAFTIFMVIQHASADLRKKYFPQLQKATKEGLLDPSDLALMEDRMLTDEGKKQKYGSQVRSIGNSGRYEPCPIEDPEHIDQIRAQVGLGPIREYMERFGIDWDGYLRKKSSGE